jgi:hypothetical protein
MVAEEELKKAKERIVGPTERGPNAQLVSLANSASPQKRKPLTNSGLRERDRVGVKM